MSQQGNFFGGFLLGTVVGGIVGGVVGVLAASRLSPTEPPSPESFAKVESKTGRKRSLRPSTEQGIEIARRGLEDKIAQLNDAIDDVRQQLSTVNGTAKEPSQGKEITPDR
jgi:gas vesicle protein